MAERAQRSLFARQTLRRITGAQPARRLQDLSNGKRNRLLPEDEPAHSWYRFVLSFPPQLVRFYLDRFTIGSSDVVLDPFCGTGTTLVECKKLGVQSVGIEAHPMAAFASEVKTDWQVESDQLLAGAQHAVREARRQIADENAPLRKLPAETARLLLKDSISPVPLHKTLALLDSLREQSGEPHHSHALLALANALVTDIGNIRFGPEVGVGPVKEDAAVLDSWLSKVRRMASDLSLLKPRSTVPAKVFCGDARVISDALPSRSVSAVITSPPYPNEKDYTRTTRLETVLLGFLRNRKELRALKQDLLRSNTRNVYKGDDDDQWIESFPSIRALAERIEEKRLALGKTSGFERQYWRVTALYFGGMTRHLSELRAVLRPGAKLAYVVGDQASYFRILIRTGQILARIAERLGYVVRDIDLFRTRFSTTTREELREEVVILDWPG